MRPGLPKAERESLKGIFCIGRAVAEISHPSDSELEAMSPHVRFLIECRPITLYMSKKVNLALKQAMKVNRVV